ncbi:hypothetical protein BDQ12DRAFT_726807 [Crucibulum laeve]|uniref:Uncharacterized protein n=1 Tax=Crucibulum laeve TaxID=68775 RepID=A0A5C3LQJ6_9AGAR|nr:hypothetical protein BDQ12DRAFT_726807 [Crucibulum laeve]
MSYQYPTLRSPYDRPPEPQNYPPVILPLVEDHYGSHIPLTSQTGQHDPTCPHYPTKIPDRRTPCSCRNAHNEGTFNPQASVHISSRDHRHTEYQLNPPLNSSMYGPGASVPSRGPITRDSRTELYRSEHPTQSRVDAQNIPTHSALAPGWSDPTHPVNLAPVQAPGPPMNVPYMHGPASHHRPSDDPNVTSYQQYMPYPAGSPFNPPPFQNAPHFPPFYQTARPPAHEGRTPNMNFGAQR